MLERGEADACWAMLPAYRRVRTSPLERRATAILRAKSAEAARHAMEAARRGRLPHFGVYADDTPNALGLIEAFASRRARRCRHGSHAGPGTSRGHRRGSLLVSTIVDDAVIHRARDSVPQQFRTPTPTEMVQATARERPWVKLFPAPAGGPAYLRSVLAPASLYTLALPTEWMNTMRQSGCAPELGGRLRASSSIRGHRRVALRSHSRSRTPPQGSSERGRALGEDGRARALTLEARAERVDAPPVRGRPARPRRCRSVDRRYAPRA